MKRKEKKRRKTTYQLIKIPSADGQITLVLIHAAAEVAHVRSTSGVLDRRAVRAALPQAVVHGLGLRGRSSGLRLGRGAGAAAEEAADGVADGGADCDTAVGKRKEGSLVWTGFKTFLVLLIGGFGSDGRRGHTYAAVEAIWPKRPGPELCWTGGAAAAGGGACCWAPGWWAAVE